MIEGGAPVVRVGASGGFSDNPSAGTEWRHPGVSGATSSPPLHTHTHTPMGEAQTY